MNKILRIRELLKEKSITISELADKMGIHRVTASNIINGNPTAESLQSIADILGVTIAELFYTVNHDNVKISENEFNNTLKYEDKHISLLANLPHFTNGDFGTFLLSFKQYNFSIVPNSYDIFKFVFSIDNLEEYIFKGDYKDSINIQLFNTFTTLSVDEHKSLLFSLNNFIHFYKAYYQDVLIKLGVLNYKRIDMSQYFKLCTISREDWIRLIKLSQKYDLDIKQNDFYVFDARGESIRVYNENYTNQSNTFKTWIDLVSEESNSYEVVLAWRAPKSFDRKSILAKDVLTAHESYILLQEELLPKARKLFKKI